MDPEASPTPKPHRRLRILLLQARHADDPAKTEEALSFARRCGVEPDQVHCHDLLEGPPTLGDLRRHDALMVGGSGEFYVSRRDLPHFDRLMDFLRQVVDLGHPTFASCFGFQCMAEALGGQVVHDPQTMEVGTYALRLTGDGALDELFGHLPSTFPAQLGRKDRALELPAGFRHLAASERCPLQAFRVPDRPIWASQFHPELTRETNLGRFLRYLDGYAAHMSEAEREEAMAGFDESPETEDLLHRFLALVFG